MYRKIKETYSFIHKDVIVWVKIDYQNNKINLLEQLGSGQFRIKPYVFVNRGVQYMNGWLTILEAMSEAVKDAKKRYEQNLAEVSKFRDKSKKNKY